MVESVEKHFTPDHIGCDEKGEEICGWKVIEQPQNIVVLFKMYKESETEETIKRMCELIIKRNFEKKVFLISADEFEREVKKYKVDDKKFNEFGAQLVTYEFIDYITGNYVPVQLVVYK